MKKLAIYLIIIVALFALMYFINQQSKKANDDKTNQYGIVESKLNPATVAQLTDENYQNIITPEQLKDRLNEKGGLFIYYFSPTCPHCVATTPVLMPIAKELNIDMKQYNLLEFNQGWKDHNIENTPTLVYYKDGKEVDRMVGGLAPGVAAGDTRPEGTDPNAGYYPGDYRNFFNKYKGS
ncbi:MAG TPA: thioredoxin family protein [Bacilli bacterium]